MDTLPHYNFCFIFHPTSVLQHFSFAIPPSHYAFFLQFPFFSFGHSYSHFSFLFHWSSLKLFFIIFFYPHFSIRGLPSSFFPSASATAAIRSSFYRQPIVIWKIKREKFWKSKASFEKSSATNFLNQNCHLRNQTRQFLKKKKCHLRNQNDTIKTKRIFLLIIDKEYQNQRKQEKNQK